MGGFVAGARVGLLVALALLVGCGEDAPEPGRYVAPDDLFERVQANVERAEALETLLEIDHSRLGAQAGSSMPPARVLLFSDPRLEADLLAMNPRVGIDLPFRVLAFESTDTGEAQVIHNTYAYVASRHGLEAEGALADRYRMAHELAQYRIPLEARAAFGNDRMQPDGIVTISSPYDFGETLRRINEAIASQDDTVVFGGLDLQARAAEHGVKLRPTTLVLFGGPGPGARAMAEAPTLGLDGFCQKFLVWTDENGDVHLSYNDLLALAERQAVPKALALRIVSRRLDSVFEEALAPE
jgi:uncharacterized protein (DUF302 family)